MPVEKPILVKINAHIVEEQKMNGSWAVNPKVEVIDKESGRLINGVTSIDISLRPMSPIKATVTIIPEVNLQTDDVLVRIANARTLELEKVAEAAIVVLRENRSRGRIVIDPEREVAFNSLANTLSEAGFTWEEWC